MGTVRKEIKVKVFRYDPQEDAEARFEEYPVEYYEGMRIWRALDSINEKQRANIAWRLSCREYLCGSCTIMVNGRPALACKTAVEDGQVLEPLPYFPIVKDLVIDRDVAANRLIKLRPWLLREDDISKTEVKLHQSDILMARDMTQCIGCLACIAVCPAIKGAWEQFNGPMYQTLIAKAAFNPLDKANRVADAIRAGAFNCTQCGACRDVCPKKIDIPEKAIGQMKVLFARQQGDGPGKAVVESVKLNYNPFGRIEPKWNWADGLGLPKSGPVLFFAGCLSSYEFGGTLRAGVELLRKVGVEPCYLAQDEPCCGEPLLRLGYENEFVKHALDFLECCKLRGVKEVITPCAECFRAFTINYPKYIKGVQLPVFRHVTQVLSDKKGRLKLKSEKIKGMKVTYHDPCRLGRDCGVYDEPRSLLYDLKGVEFVEMEKTRRDAVCCGAGGGVKLVNSPFAEEMGMTRLEMAKQTGASMLVTACPWCQWNFRDAMAKGGGTMVLKNIVDLVNENL